MCLARSFSPLFSSDSSSHTTYHGHVDKLVKLGHHLVSLYKEVGVSQDRVLLRMPATWAAVKAGKQLEGEGIACHLVLVYR